MLHERSLHRGRAFPQALLFISAMEDARRDRAAGALPVVQARKASSSGNAAQSLSDHTVGPVRKDHHFQNLIP
jgi:hypothetical protein